MSGLISNPSALLTVTRYILNAVFMKFEHEACFLVAGLFGSVWVCLLEMFITYHQLAHTVTDQDPLFFHVALKMASILQKLITPLFSGPPEPPRNKVTVVGVGQVGMACAISILLRVRASAPVVPLLQITLLPAAVTGRRNTQDPQRLTPDY